MEIALAAELDDYLGRTFEVRPYDASFVIGELVSVDLLIGECTAIVTYEHHGRIEMIALDIGDIVHIQPTDEQVQERLAELAIAFRH